MFTLHNGDCLQVMPFIPSGSIDAIITDLPYGTTACEWDSIIPLAPMWEQVKRVLKPNGVFITTSSQPFTSALIMSNPKMFREERIWEKSRITGSMLAKKRALKNHENIIIFSNGNHTYNPIMWKGNKNHGSKDSVSFQKYLNRVSVYPANTSDIKYPRTIIKVDSLDPKSYTHPTQKPLDLYRYLIRTYTNEGDTILDICMGSGTTIEAAEIEGRNSIGIEKEIGYFQIAEKRSKSAVLQQRLFTPSNNRLHLDVGDSPAQQALFTPEADTAEGKLPAPAPRR